MPKLKIKEYIEKGKIKYDNQFDYSQSEATYNTVTRKCVIRCTKHNHIFFG